MSDDDIISVIFSKKREFITATRLLDTFVLAPGTLPISPSIPFELKGWSPLRRRKAFLKNREAN